MITLIFKIFNFYKSNKSHLLITTSILLIVLVTSIAFYTNQKVKSSNVLKIYLNHKIGTLFIPKTFIPELETFIHSVTKYYLQIKNIKNASKGHLVFNIAKNSIDNKDLNSFTKKQIEIFIQKNQNTAQESQNTKETIILLRRILSYDIDIIKTHTTSVGLTKRLNMKKLIALNILFFGLFVFYPLLITEYRNLVLKKN